MAPRRAPHLHRVEVSAQELPVQQALELPAPPSILRKKAPAPRLNGRDSSGVPGTLQDGLERIHLGWHDERIDVVHARQLSDSLEC